VTAEVEVRVGDLLTQDVEAIVNPWNRNVLPWWLLLPQGVSGAIKKAAGFGPFRELSSAGWLSVGDAVITKAGRLPFRAIIHVAGLTLLWRSSETIVRRCVRNAIAVAIAHDIRSIAFPLIGAGTGGLNPQRVQNAIIEEVAASPYDGRVVVVVFPA
jgi:O-acetyl-ADP-ribose deacetylase (regulator of RNase III)